MHSLRLLKLASCHVYKSEQILSVMSHMRPMHPRLEPLAIAVHGREQVVYVPLLGQAQFDIVAYGPAQQVYAPGTAATSFLTPGAIWISRSPKRLST